MLCESCYLYLNAAAVAAVPVKCSRHNTPSRCHAVTRLIQNCCNSAYQNKYIVIVCEYQELFATACAVTRAFPQYNKKTGFRSTQIINVIVEFIIFPNNSKPLVSVGDYIKLNDQELQAVEYAAFGIALTMRIVDTPCNEMSVDNFLQEIDSIGNSLKINPTIIRGKALIENGFGGISCVGQAAATVPALAILSYRPPGAKITVAWVGKGIVYDTGGLSLKGRLEMVRMKQDCGGAAAILGAFYAVVKAQFSQNLHAVFCLAENAIGPLAVRPDDIHTLYSGRTVEVNNTDAEGRLVLADGVVYANRNLNADIILDMATLTGTQLIATGKYHAALLTNNEAWEDLCMQAGRTSGDLVFPIPFTPELHLQEFDSVVADVKNSLQRSNASSSCAGLFILYHLGVDYPGVWMHLDIAAPVTQGERATGYGVALLCTLFGNYCNNSLLNSIAPLFGTMESFKDASGPSSSGP